MRAFIEVMVRSLGRSVVAVAALAASGCGAAEPGAQEDAAMEGVARIEQALTITENGWAWVRADGALGYGHRSPSASISSTRLSLGRYRVDAPGAVNPNRQVVAYGNSNASCQLYGGATGSSMYVDCYSPDGARADSDFVFAFDKRVAPSYSGAGGYLSSTAGGYAYPGYAWNSSGGVNTVTWDAAAQEYTASLPGLNFYNASVHVSANYPSPRRCKVRYWGTGLVRVRCLDFSGNPVQSMFDLAYNQMTLHGSRVGGHSWIPNGTPSSWYSAAQSSISCFSPGSFSATAVASDLSVTLTEPYNPPTSWTQFFPMVTAYGSSADYCKVRYWNHLGGYSTSVRCFDTTGTQISSSSTAFNLTFTDNAWPGPC